MYNENKILFYATQALGFYNFLRGFSRAYKQGGLYPDKKKLF